MRQIVIISGKGGTGKTVITASFAAIAESKVMADCDVDAADLHLLLTPEIKEKGFLKSGKTAEIDPDKCVKCGKCLEVCRFRAVQSNFVIDPVSCEGCSFCSLVCPERAISMRENVTGEWFVSNTRFGPMVHAKLGIAEENSGKLVNIVKSKAKELAQNNGARFVIVDGAPGIGCPVIASISEADIALIVTEPTISGMHDADRVIKVARHFSVPIKLTINKYDLNMDMSDIIEDYCRKNNIDVVGKVPFDEVVVEAMVSGKTIIEYSAGKTAQIIKKIWNSVSS